MPDGICGRAQYDGSYLFGDFVCGKIFQLVPDGAGGYTATEFASDVGGDRGDGVRASGPLRRPSTTWLDDQPGHGLYRIAYTGDANRSPQAVAQASPTSGDLPLTVNFDGTQSSDPDNDTLSFDWDFGDGSSHASAATASHEYQTPGTYTATLTVSDGQGGQDTATIRIDAGNNAPTPSIASPAADQQFRVGETITLSGQRDRPRGRDRAGLQLELAGRQAPCHAHAPVPAADRRVTAPRSPPRPEDFGATTNSYLEVRLTATDSQGFSTTVSRDLRPRLVNLGFATNPAGLRLELNGTTAPPSHHLLGWLDAAARRSRAAVRLRGTGTDVRLVVGRRRPISRDHDAAHRYHVHCHLCPGLRLPSLPQSRPRLQSAASAGRDRPWAGGDLHGRGHAGRRPAPGNIGKRRGVRAGRE